MRSILIFILIVSAGGAHSQELADGFVITHQSDTLLGQIKVTGEAAMHRKCTFVKGGDITIFEPEDVEGFGIQYYGFRDRLFKNLDNKMFIELKAMGPLTLQKFKADYYLMNSNDTVIINSRHYYVMDEYGNRRLKESNVWKFKLKALTEDCLDDFNFDQLQFSAKNLK